MRNPARIPRILEKLQALWEKNPDQRLMQLLCNTEPMCKYVHPGFYLEDTDLEWAIDHYYDEPEGNYN